MTFMVNHDGDVFEKASGRDGLAGARKSRRTKPGRRPACLSNLDFVAANRRELARAGFGMPAVPNLKAVAPRH